MAEEIPKKTVMALLVLVILISVLSTMVVLTAVSEGKEISQETGVETALTPQKTSSSGTVSLTILERPNEE